MFELIGVLVLELIFSVVLGSLFELFTQVVHNFFRPAREASRTLAVVGLLGLGGLSGAGSTLLIGERVMPIVGVPGLSLVVAPCAAGAILHSFGRVAERKGFPHTSLMTWWGGATFAFAVSAARLIALG